MIQFTKRLLVALAGMASSYWEAHSTKGRIWLLMGIIGLIVDAALCYQYGITQTVWHGIGFAVVALFFSQLPDGAYEEWLKGNKLASLVLWAATIAFGAVAYQSHIGYGAGVRYGDIKLASLQDARYEGISSTAKENASNVAMWKQQLADLTTQNAWAATVSADGLRKEVESLKNSRDSEAKIKRCGSKCRAIEDKIAEVSGKIAVAEQREDLTKRIEATQRLVDQAREKVAKTDAGLSSVAMQTTANTQLFGLVRAYWTGENLEQALKTTEDSAKLANLLITAAGSFAFMLMAPVGFFMAGRNRRPEAPMSMMPKIERPAEPPAWNGTPTKSEQPAHGNINLARVTIGEVNRAKLEKLLMGGALPQGA